jgi:hypothetical protein
LHRRLASQSGGCGHSAPRSGCGSLRNGRFDGSPRKASKVAGVLKRPIRRSSSANPSTTPRPIQSSSNRGGVERAARTERR